MHQRIAFYIRVSKEEQTAENQMLELTRLAELEQWKDITVFEDEGITGSLGREARPGFDELLNRAARGHFDIVAAWSLDRLGREPADVFELAKLASRKGFTIYLHKDRIDTGTAAGELFFTIMAGMAKFERRRLQERVKAGLERARAQGKTLGRPVIQDPELISRVKTLRIENNYGIKRIAKETNIAVGTVYRLLKKTIDF